MASHALNLYYILLLCLHCFASATSAAVPAVYAFGDSLADVGNNNHLPLSILKADFPHNGVDFPGGHATGRYSNGRNTADFFAEKLGLETSPPYLSIVSSFSNKTDAFLKGVSFASGGAGVLEATNVGMCISFNKQIRYFSKVYTHLVQQLGSVQAQDHISRSIFSFVIGSNDIIEYTKLSGDRTPQQLVDLMIPALRGQLKTLYNLGARKFAFVGTGLIGCCPSLRARNSSGGCNADANSVALLYAQASASLLAEMKSELSDMSYSFFNSSLALQHYLQNPADFGFTVVDKACCGLGNLNAKVACLPISALCPNRANHMFWDLFHPTETTARLLTDAFYEGSAPLVYPINLQQLSSL